MNVDTSPQRFSASYRANQSSLPALAANADLERKLLEKQLNEQRLLRELAYKEETLQMFQLEKNKKMDQYQLKVQQQILRLRRKFETQIDGLNRKLSDTDKQLRQSLNNCRQLEFANNGLLTQISGLQKDKLRLKQQNKSLNEHINKLTDALKLIQLQQKQLRQKNTDMQDEILVILEVQRDKSKQILLLTENEKALQNKLITLQTTLTQLQSHLQQLSQKLHSKDLDCEQFRFIIGKMDAQIQSKETMIINLQQQLQQAIRRQKIRQAQVSELMSQNERLYTQLTRQKHRVKDLAVQYKIKI